MPPQRELWTDAVFKVLADDQWHSRAELYDAAAPLVPHGRAARLAERNRARKHRQRWPNTPVPPRSNNLNEFDLVDIGARAIVLHSINAAVRLGTIERQAPDQYRRRQTE